MMGDEIVGACNRGSQETCYQIQLVTVALRKHVTKYKFKLAKMDCRISQKI